MERLTATVPVWVLTMGPLILEGKDFIIPYDQIALIVVSLVIPCGIGIVVQRYLPK